MFEVWDCGKEENNSVEQKDAFLGLGIVSVEELHIASTSRHVIPLQGRPYYGTEDDDENNINGLLTVEFVLIEKKYSRKVKPTLGNTEKHNMSRIKDQGTSGNKHQFIWRENPLHFDFNAFPKSACILLHYMAKHNLHFYHVNKSKSKVLAWAPNRIQPCKYKY